MYEDDDFGDDFGAFDAGTAYALFRHGQDRQTAQLLGGLGGRGPETIEVHVHNEDPEENARPIDALDFSTIQMPDDWTEFVGQEPLKQQLSVYVTSAQKRNEALPHILLASGYPGVGKTTMARLIAKMMGVDIYEIVPPFNINTLVECMQKLGNRDILFIDEIHKLADNGQRGAEILLKVLEEKVAYMPTGEVIPLADITVIGATTDAGKLPKTVLDRFKHKPYFGAYSWVDLGRITCQFAYLHGVGDDLDDEVMTDIAGACRGTPRIIEEMVLAARAMFDTFGRAPTSQELLEFLEVEPDGLTRTHIHYLTALRQYFARRTKDETVEYIVGEAAIQQILRETKPGLQAIEGFLVERGLIDRTPRGRRLTDLGIQRAEEFIAAGKGASDVA